MLIKRIALKGYVMPLIYKHYLFYSLPFLIFKNFICSSWIVSRWFKTCFNAYWLQLDRGVKRTKHVQEGKPRWVLFCFVFFSLCCSPRLLSFFLKNHENIITRTKSSFLDCHKKYNRLFLVSGLFVFLKIWVCISRRVLLWF